MSATTQPKREGALDAYYTPDQLARSAVRTLGNLRGLRVWEPHAGGGAFCRALHAAGALVTASDINPDAPALTSPWSASFVGDFLSYPHDPCDMPAWVVGNPPFNAAEEHIRHALAHASIGVAFLLRLAFLEGAKRAPFWKWHPPSHVYVLTSRPSFTDGGTDSAAYGWFIWRRHEVNYGTRLLWLDWRACG